MNKLLGILATVVIVIVVIVAFGWSNIKPAKPQATDTETHVCKFNQDAFTEQQIKDIKLDTRWRAFVSNANHVRELKHDSPLEFKLVACEEKDSMRIGDTVYVTTPMVSGYPAH
jgi:hypothetical protein